MRTRAHDWFDERTHAPMYGLQVYVHGKWMHCAEGGKPCIYPTQKERDAKRRQFRRMPAPPAPIETRGACR